MKRFFLLIVLGFLWLSFSPSRVFATEEFFTAYEVTYEAFLSGTMKITQNIALTNKLSNIYASRYSLIFEGKEVKNVKAFDGQGELEVALFEEENKTTISLNFNEKVVGKDKTLKFTVSYESPHLLQKAGEVWEVTVPRLARPEEIDEYLLNLVVPAAFGKPAFISPQPLSSSSEEGKQVFRFNKNQMALSGIVASFGQFQTFDFVLTYHLENKKLKAIKTQIALPAETNYQKVSFSQIEPEPENVTVDQDGNFLATYFLGPAQKLDIQVAGQAKIFSFQENKFYNRLSDRENYLAPQPFWEQTPAIKELAAELKTPEKIYQYVVKTLTYDYARVREGAKRLGAEQILKDPERAICTEYTDLFIALARAAGIPAREINGYAYTTNSVLQPLSLVQDVLHSWPEYWDNEKNTWIQVDPTWENTTGGIDYFNKLDLGHFAFVIHGQDSTYPPPAGAYKLPGTMSKDVVISFGQYREGVKKFVLEANLPEEIISERKSSGHFLVVNQGSETLYNLPISFETENLTLLNTSHQQIEVLPPFGKVEVSILLKPNKFSLRSWGKLTVFIGDQSFEYDLRIKSFLFDLVPPIFGLLLCLLAIYFLTGQRK